MKETVILYLSLVFFNGLEARIIITTDLLGTLSINLQHVVRWKFKYIHKLFEKILFPLHVKACLMKTAACFFCMPVLFPVVVIAIVKPTLSTREISPTRPAFNWTITILTYYKLNVMFKFSNKHKNVIYKGWQIFWWSKVMVWSELLPFTHWCHREMEIRRFVKKNFLLSL